MKRAPKPQRRRLRIPLLILGAYLIFMGITEMIMSRWESPPETARCLLGAVMAGFGVLAIWDGCRDKLTPRKKPEEPVQHKQAILTVVDGKRQSDVSREVLREQLTLLAEREAPASFSLELLPVPEVPGLGWMERVVCAYEGSHSVSAHFVTGEGACIALRKSGIPTAQAEESLLRILDGTMDFLDWEDGAWGYRPFSEEEEPYDGLLVLWGDGWQERLPFFSERDLELAVEGLACEKYTRAELYRDGWWFLVFPEHREEGAADSPKMILQMIYRIGNHSRVYEKKGGVAQVQEWLVELYQDGWNPFDWVEKTP